MERRLLQRRLRDDIYVEIDWGAVQDAGDLACTDLHRGNRREHGFLMAGSLVPDGQGGTRAKVSRLLPLGSGSRNHFDVTPALANRINNHQHAPGERTMGIAHTHLPEHADGPTGTDVQALQAYANTQFGLVLKVGLDGGGKISVCDGDGQLDYTIRGNGNVQHFTAHESSVVDTQRLAA